MECFELPGVGIPQKGSVHVRQLRRERPAAKVKPDFPFGLSLREMTVLYLLTEGLADKEIATVLGVTAYTVNKHVGAILAKMDARSRTAAAVRAIKEGVLSDDSSYLVGYLPFGQDEPGLAGHAGASGARLGRV